MASLNILQKAYMVGLDFGSSSIKLVQLIKKEGNLTLVRTDSRNIAPAKNNESKDHLLPVLKELLKGIEIKKSQFVVSINSPHAGIRVISVPHMPKSELKESLKMEAQNYFPFPVEASQLDFEILGETLEEGVRKLRVCVAMAPSELISTYLSVLKRVSIKPLSMIPVACALQKLCHASSEVGGETTHCLVDIGEQHTECVIFKGKNLVFSRKIPVAGMDFTKALTGVLISEQGRTDLSLSEAEKIKREVGISPEDQYTVIDNKISTNQILSLLRSSLEQLAGEMDRCFNYYREETGGGRIDTVTLCGGGASLKGLAPFLSEALGVEVKVGYPLKGFKIEPQAVPSQGFHAFAAALGSALSFGEGVNLLPPELKDETKRTFKRATVQSVLVSLVLVAAFIYTGMRLQLVNFQKRIEVAHLELSSLQSQLEEAEKQILAREILAEEPYWGDVLRDLSHLTGEDLYLMSLRMLNKVILLRGRIISREKEETLSGFCMRLESGIFKDVKLVTTKAMSNKKASEFELECWVD